MIYIYLKSFLLAAINFSVPLLYTASGGLILVKAGIFNVGMEGMMLAGAFLGFYGALITGNPWVGLLLAIMGGALLGLMLAYAAIFLRGNQLILGFGINFFILGLTGFFYRMLCSSGLITLTTRVKNFSPIYIPFLSKLPILGEIFFNHNFLTYLAILLVIFVNWFFYKTTYGLSLLSVGENPEVADASGINVYLVQYMSAIASGVLAGIGGAFLTLTQVTIFTENMTAGGGFIALAIIVFGKFQPWGMLWASLFFGAGDALVSQLQIIGIRLPTQITFMLPYALAIVALAGVVGKVKGPSAAMKPFIKN